MNCFKKAIAAVSVMLIALTAAACHPKDEVAVTVGDVKFTSAYYMCALINADSQAKSKVKESLSDDKSSTDVDYYSKKVDDKDFVKWVEDTALETLKEIAAYKTLCKENKLEIPDDEKTQAETHADYYWSSYGYSAYFEPNGVGQSTYKQYMLDSYYSNLYFKHLYGAEGTKAIDSETVKQKMYDNFVIADLLQVSFSSKTDDEKTLLKEKVHMPMSLRTAKKHLKRFIRIITAPPMKRILLPIRQPKKSSPRINTLRFWALKTPPMNPTSTILLRQWRRARLRLSSLKTMPGLYWR